VHNSSLQVALASESFVQLGFLMALPMMMEIGLERGFRTALSDFVLMQLQLASVFFTFSLGTKNHYYGRTLLHGGAEYRATGRGFVVFHAKFAENYRLYSRSHFVNGIELMILLVVYEIFGQSYRGALTYIFITVSMWFMVGTWLFAPFLFNPSGFEWQKIGLIGTSGSATEEVLVRPRRKAGSHGGTRSNNLSGTLGSVVPLLKYCLQCVSLSTSMDLCII
jgi:callose synthase